MYDAFIPEHEKNMCGLGVAVLSVCRNYRLGCMEQSHVLVRLYTHRGVQVVECI